MNENRRLTPGNLLVETRLLFYTLLIVICTSSFGMAQAGQLDPTFGTGGIFTSNFGSTAGAIANAVALQSDGKIIVGGAGGPGGKAGLARITPSGALDKSFGNGGVVTSNFDDLAAESTWGCVL